MSGDINPGFAFDIEDASQAPWELEGAWKDEPKKSKHSSLDDKIRQHLKTKTKRNASKQSLKSVTKQGRRDSGSESEDYDENMPLPGEDESEGDSEIEESESEIENSEDEQGQDLNGINHHFSGEESESDSEELDVDSEGESEDEEDDVDMDEIDQVLDESDPEEEDKSLVKPKKGDAPHKEVLQDRRDSHKAASTSSFFAKTPEGTKFSAGSFEEMNLSKPLLKACRELGYQNPTPIQAACIPLALAGRDILGSAMTGSGKTAAFSLPMLEKLIHRNRKISAIYALVLVPTRELAVQVHSMMQKLAQYTDVRIALIVGGLSLQVQTVTLKSNPEIIVATPGRLIDHLRNSESFGLEDLQLLILDEADRLLEMGFSEEINEILKMSPRKRQTVLYSATMTEEVSKLASLSLQSPVKLSADPKATAPHQLVQEVVRIKDKDKAAKEAILLAMCSRGFQKGKAIVFFRTKKQAHRAKMLFGLTEIGPTAELHGDMTQTARLESLDSFRKGEVAFLLATDVAARGLDILGLETVINYDCPSNLPSYLHRIGRTARAGKAGRSVTFVDDDDRKLVKEIVKQKIKLQERVIPPALVKKWWNKIEQLTPAIENLVYEEREERQLRKAEMEMTKAENMIEHETEIYSKPARTWFQTKKEKALAAKKEEIGDQKQSNKRERDDKRNAEKQKRGESKDDPRKKPKLMQETMPASKNIRAIKSKQTELRQQGLPTVKAGKVAAHSVTGKSGSDKKKKAKQNDRVEKASGSEMPAKVYAGGQKSKRFKPPGKSKEEKKKLRLGGKGSKGFKSKKKFKRK